MRLLQQTSFLLHLTRTHGIVRRYFVVNGFDGALTMLGLIMGFQVSGPTPLPVVISACMGAAIALAISGVSSAYLSESAERRRDLSELEGAMVTDLQESAHAEAARRVPLLVALVNGMAPLVVALPVILPIWLANRGLPLPLPPLPLAILVDLLCIFLLGVFLSRIAAIAWWRSGLQTLLIALVTAVLIYLLAGG